MTENDYPDRSLSGKGRTAQTNTGTQFLNKDTTADDVKSRRRVKQYIMIVKGKVDVMAWHGMAWHGSLGATISTVCRLLFVFSF